MEPQKQNGTRRTGRPLKTRKRGRPSIGKRVGLGLRITPEMKARIEAQCEIAGRSQSQEVEMRLERSFWLDDMLKAKLLCELPEIKAASRSKDKA